VHLFASTPFPAKPYRSVARLALAFAACATLAACATDDRSGRAFYQPYRPSVQQGNWITQQQVSQLQPGMTREQVRFILGTPTLTPLFHAERWDYPYRFKPGYGEVEQRRFTVYFENDRLVRWDGDPQPTLQPFQQALEGAEREVAAEGYNERYLVPDVTVGEPGGAIGTQGTVNPDAEVIGPAGLPPPGSPLEAEAVAPELPPGSPGAEVVAPAAFDQLIISEPLR